jgi:2-dehydro-3-deoxygalactonokinase
MSLPGFVAVAWGNAGFRAWLMAPDGRVLDSRESGGGLSSVRDRDFAGVLRANCGPWLSASPGVPVLLSGMVGSRTGWQEAPYAPCPLGANELVGRAARLRLDGHELLFLPGAVSEGSDGALDIMRGEELQILGAARSRGIADATICIPGTHAKCATLRNGRLTGFRTYVTGELFKLLRHDSLVGALAEGDEFDEAAFARGIHRGMDVPLSHAVFAARADALNGRLAPKAVSSYLSGILIGGELADYPEQEGPPLLLIASGTLAERYETALHILARPFERIDARQAALAGFALVGPQLLAAAA